MSATQERVAAESERRANPLDIDPSQFRAAGHALVDRIADLLSTIRDRPVAPPDATPSSIRAQLGDPRLPETGGDPVALLDRATSLLVENSTFNGHPRFFGYITASAAPIGILADLLASAINPNCGAWSLSPAATEIERQAVRWVAEFIGFPSTAGGLLVSGGNMANMVCFLAARAWLASKNGWDLKGEGNAAGDLSKLTVYTSGETHTWIQKAGELFGLGGKAIRWIDVDDGQRMRMDRLREQIAEDRRAGFRPFMVVGTGGSVATGAVDPLDEIAALCKAEDIWFHVDGAYGAPAARVPGAPASLASLGEADSVAIDPHKWLYNPLEAGCALVREPNALLAAFSFRPSYYHFAGPPDDPPTNFYEWGPQNSRGFRALKVWLGFKHVGRAGYTQLISDDIALARRMYEKVGEHPELEALTYGLSIVTFRYVPRNLPASLSAEERTKRLNDINSTLLTRLQEKGVVYLSNAVIDGVFSMRACIVNFRTTLADVDAIPEIIAAEGRALTA